MFSQTCGHYVHFDCFFDYLKLKKEPVNEMNCPLCAQSANCLLPIMKSKEKKDLESISNTYLSVLSSLQEEFKIHSESLKKVIPSIGEILMDLFNLPPYDTRILGVCVCVKTRLITLIYLSYIKAQLIIKPYSFRTFI